MLISHHHRFVFLAYPRTASTATMQALAQHADVRSRHVTQCTPEFPFNHHISARKLKAVFDQRGWKWSSYRRFCVVRNPYDRIVSHYHWRRTFRKHHDRGLLFNAARYVRHKLGEPKDFKTFVLRLDTKAFPMLLLQNFIGDEDGRPLVDDILRYENLATELHAYMRKLDIELDAESLVRVNATPLRGPVREYYDEGSAARIARLFAYEIERFGYVL